MFFKQFPLILTLESSDMFLNNRYWHGPEMGQWRNKQIAFHPCAWKLSDDCVGET